MIVVDRRRRRRSTTSRTPTAIADTIAELEDLDGILAVTDPFSEIVNGQVSDDGDAAIVRMQFDGQATDVPPETKTALQDVAAELRDELPAGSQVALGGDLFAAVRAGRHDHRGRRPAHRAARADRDVPLVRGRRASRC